VSILALQEHSEIQLEQLMLWTADLVLLATNAPQAPPLEINAQLELTTIDLTLLSNVILVLLAMLAVLALSILCHVIKEHTQRQEPQRV
jgi:hypothetical protein